VEQIRENARLAVEIVEAARGYKWVPNGAYTGDRLAAAVFEELSR
jgi:hypothetical protein